MIAKSTLNLGGNSYEFQFDDRSEMESMSKAITLASPPTYCTVCRNTDKNKFILVTNKDGEGNIYVNVKCINSGCGAKVKLGQYKAGGYFWHKDFEKWAGKSNAPTTSATKTPTNDTLSEEKVAADDIPF